MEINLSPEFESIVQQCLQNGSYESASAVVQQALSVLRDFDTLDSALRDDLRSKIDEGLADIKAGCLVDGKAVFDRLEAELDRLERTGHV